MGTVYKLNCEKCGYEFKACLGNSGFFDYYEVNLNDVLNGKYGEELQKLIKEQQVELLPLSSKIFIKCRDCGHFEVVPNLLIRREVDDSITEYQHKCRVCGGEVESFSDNLFAKNFSHVLDFFHDDKGFKRNQDGIKFECPNCHEELIVMEIGTWD